MRALSFAVQEENSNFAGVLIYKYKRYGKDF